MNSKSAKTLPELYSEINAILPKLIDFGEARLHVDESSASVYRSEEYWRMFYSSFLPQVQEILSPGLVIDVGANVGFMSLRFARAFPDATVVAVEPNPYLIDVIRRNCSENGLENVRIVNAAVGDTVEESVGLQVNLAMSVDSRVKGLTGNFEKVSVPQTTIDEILAGENYSGAVFVKVDTQGYEDKVIEGARSLFTDAFNPMILMEYAPCWMEEAGGDPDAFLHDLVSRYNVAENPAQGLFYATAIEDILARSIALEDTKLFADYTRGLSKQGRGWCDLLITK